MKGLSQTMDRTTSSSERRCFCCDLIRHNHSLRGQAGIMDGRFRVLLLLLWLVPQSTVFAGQGAPQTSNDQRTESRRGSSDSSQSSKQQPRSLDELLGVPSPSVGDAAGAAAADEGEEAKKLQRSLNESSIEDLVLKAIEGMRSASERLAGVGDAGIGTQRIQEDVVRTLDRLLEEAGKQKNRKASKGKQRQGSSQPRNSGDSEPPEPSGQQSARADAEQSSSSPSEATASGSRDQVGDETREEIAGSQGELDETRIEWGRLPERVRELVLQGRRDRVSTVYERLTREYYRRLAEEASK
jgi:hypothetical protein